MAEKQELEILLKAVKALKKESELQKTMIKGLEKRIRALEPQAPDEMVVRTASGELGLYLVRDEEGNYVAPTNRTEL